MESGELRKAVEISSQTPQEKQPLQQSISESNPSDADRPLVGLEIPKAPKDLKEIALHTKSNSDNTCSVQNGRTTSVCSNASGVRSVSTPNQEVTELDIETNTFCPPPLYYTHLTQEKVSPIQGKITIKPQMDVPDELDGTFPEEKLVNPPLQANPLKHTNSATPESPPVLINPPYVQDVGARTQTTHNTQTEQNRINTIRQLPLLNALLVELSLLYNQPTASPAHIHPHLAWLYRTKDKSPESSAKSTCKSESEKEKPSVWEKEKSMGLQDKRNQAESLKKDKYFEKNSGSWPKRVPRGKLLYGLTNTLKLRLKQTNPGMLVVHEKREEYRKMKAQLDAKLRSPSSKIKVLSFAEQHKKPHQLPKDKYVESDASFAENDTSKQISGVFDDPSTAKETKPKTEKAVDGDENRTSKGPLEEIVRLANSIAPERFVPTQTLEGKVEMKVQRPCVFPQVAAVDRIVVDKEIDVKQIKTTDNDILLADVSENKPSKNSCSESISKLKYSDDFTSPCYSEDFCTTEDTSTILQAYCSGPRAENSQCTSKSSETRFSIRKNNSEKNSVLNPPFSVCSPVYSYKKSQSSKTRDESLEEESSISTTDLYHTGLRREKTRLIKNRMHNSKVLKKGQGISVKLKTRTGCKSLENSQSPWTSQVSSYLPSTLSELEFNVLDSSTSDQVEEDEVGSLNISKQCKDICELVINKLPGYTV